MKIFRGENYQILKINALILLILLVGGFFVYFISNPFANTLFYSALFLAFLRSKRIIFWTAVLFIVLNNPWGLFYYKPNDWILRISSTMGLTYSTLFGFLFIIKVNLIKRPRLYLIKDYLRPYYKVFAFFIIFLLFWSFAFGFSMAAIYMVVSFLPSFLLFIVIPRLFRYGELKQFNKIVFLFSIIHTIGAILDIVTRGGFITILTFGNRTAGIAYTEEIIRVVGGITIAFYSMQAALFYLALKIRSFKSWYLWVVVLISWTFILSSATRGWMIATFLELVIFFVYYARRSLISTKGLVTIVLSIGLGLLFLPSSFKNNLNAAFDRLETVEALAEGDLTAEGTASRWDVRGPRALTRFKESPIFGFGYSRVTASYYDPHVGNHSLLLSGGIVGLTIIWLTAIAMVFYFYQIDQIGYRTGSFVIGIAIIGIMFIHSTSRAMVSYLMPTDTAFLLALLFNHSNALAYHVKHNFTERIDSRIK